MPLKNNKELEEIITEQRRVMQDILKQALSEDFDRRIKISLITLNNNNKTSYLNAYGNIIISLKNSISHDDVLFAIDRLDLINFAYNYNNNLIFS